MCLRPTLLSIIFFVLLYLVIYNNLDLQRTCVEVVAITLATFSTCGGSKIKLGGDEAFVIMCRSPPKLDA